MTKELTIDKDRRIEIPEEALKILQVKPGSKLRLKILEDGRVLLEPYHSIWEIRGSVDPRGVKLTVAQMDKIITQEVVKSVMP